MSLYLYQNDQQTGPFSEEQIGQMLQTGTVTPDTLSWKEGMETWSPLSSLHLSPGREVVPPAPPAMSKSPLGLISFYYSLFSFVGWAILLVMAGVAHNNGTATPTFNMIIGFLLMGGLFLNFVAMIVGVIGAFKSKANTLAILGACLNAFALVGLVGLMILGLAASRGGG